MALPAIAIGAAKAYSAYKTAKDIKGGIDTVSELAKVSERSSGILDQVKNAISTFDGGVTSRQEAGGQGTEVDMPNLAGILPENPGDAAPGMTPDESSFYQGVIAGMIRTMDGPEESPQGPESNSPSSPGM